MIYALGPLLVGLHVPDEKVVNDLLVEVEDRIDTVSATATTALHRLLDAPGEPPTLGDPLPPLWHWLTFLPDAAQCQLGQDGHPLGGAFMPVNRPPKRMFAGGRLSFDHAAFIGAPLRRYSRATSVAEKEGRTGNLLFVEITHEISTDDATAVLDVQDIVYRGGDSGQSTSSADLAQSVAHDQWEWSYELDPSPPLLFRFSALTYNAHRIHYDRPYASEVEGYQNLVVHGPLQAIALAEICRRYTPERRMASFDFRALRPAFAGTPLLLRGRPIDSNTVELQAVSREHGVSMRATAVLAS